MVFFVVAFYSFLLVSHFLFSDKEAKKEHEARSHAQAQWMKEKEEIALRNLSAHPRLAGAISLGFAAVFLCGLYLDAAYLIKKWRGADKLSVPFQRSEVLWGERDVFQMLLFLFFMEGCLFLAQSVAWLFLGLEGGRTPDGVLLLNSLARDLGVTCFVVWIVQRRYGQSLQALGFRAQNLWQGIRTGVVAYVAVIPPLVLCFMILAAVLRFFSVEPEPQEVVQIYLKDSTQPYLLVLTLFVAVAGPVMEEIFFRGFAYSGLRKRFGVWPGAVLSSAVFAALHMHWVAFFPIFFLGMFLTALYETSGSLVPSIIAHALHNTVMVVLMLGFRNLSSG
jgi:hypothetical protein